jgi:glutaredoxin-related protein
MREAERKFKLKIVAALSVTLVIFLVGMMVGDIIANLRLGESSRLAKEIRLHTLEAELHTKLVEEHLCKTDVFELTKERSELGRKLDFLEKNLGKKNKDVLELKREYTVLMVNQWLLLEEFKRRCNQTNVNIILFFYSNNETYSKFCEAQGFVLDSLYLQHPKEIVIYSFDIDLDSEIIRTLKEIYNIKTLPSLVIEGKVYEGVIDKQSLEKILQLSK